MKKQTNTGNNTQSAKIRLPHGCFCSNNCTDCAYANWNAKDADGWIKCNNSNISATFVDPSRRYGCWHYKYEKQ